MGDRLVQIIRYKGKFLAASYEHWSASEANVHEEKLNDAITKYDLFDDKNATPELAVKCLIESIKAARKSRPGLTDPNWTEYIWGENGNKLIQHHSNIQQQFNKDHPEFPEFLDRNDGLITVDEEIADDWMGWAEALNNFDWTD